MAYGLPQQWAGKLDRRIKILKHSVTFNELNEPVEEFTEYAVIWANVMHLSVREINSAESVRAVKMANIVIRWRTDIDEQDRIIHDGDTYKIQGTTELGRREMLQLLVEYVEGNA